MTTRGIITLVFDDGYQHVLDDIIPLLDKHDIPAVFAIPFENNSLEEETGHPVADVPVWQKALDGSSHELAAHSITHRNLSILHPNELEIELKMPAQTLPAATLVYPGGGHNQAVIKLAKKYYRAARTVHKGFNTNSPSDPFRLKTYNFTRDNFSVTKANLLALYAYATNSWLIETYHIVNDQDKTNAHAISLKAFKRHLQFLRKLPTSIQTINQVISSN